MAWVWPSEYGYGCGPTQALVDKLQLVQSVGNEEPNGPNYRFTIVTDHRTYELDFGNPSSAACILAVDREFLTLGLSSTVQPDTAWEKVYVRLCSIRAIQEHFFKS